MPYTYLIGWSKLGYWYYGCRYAKAANPSDLWVKYFTTSKLVKEMRIWYGEPDIIQVRRVFDNADACRRWEHKVLRRMNVVKDPRWINKTDNIAIDTDFHKGFLGGKHKPEVIELLRKSKLGKKRPPFSAEWRQRLVRSGSENGMFGRRHSLETRMKMSVPKTDEQRKAISERQMAHYAKMTPEQRKRPEEVKMKISQTKRAKYASQTSI